eukprot:2604266-Rhodomonas_salina.1
MGWNGRNDVGLGRRRLVREGERVKGQVCKRAFVPEKRCVTLASPWCARQARRAVCASLESIELHVTARQHVRARLHRHAIGTKTKRGETVFCRASTLEKVREMAMKMVGIGTTRERSNGSESGD